MRNEISSREMALCCVPTYEYHNMKTHSRLMKKRCGKGGKKTKKRRRGDENSAQKRFSVEK
jgi:hypothetical protein